ncbi:MAG: drug:proton antiporter [Actinomycetota bacterium]|nr:MAG: drug:proton antiporter [Actinomycetota bacterium]
MANRSGAIETDVLVVGAGPGGSATAYHLARHGLDVTVLERCSLPREKVCGDGLTPRSVRALQRMGVDTSDPGFERIVGLRVYSRRTVLELPWPKLRGLPDYGLVRTRADLDDLLARRARWAGARILERTEAVAPLVDDGWVRGVLARPAEEREAEPFEVRARMVVAADGAPSKLGVQLGVVRDERRPLGIAARRYYRIERRPGPWFESWLDLREGDTILPGYGWLFPLPDGTVNVGAGLLSTFRDFRGLSAQRLFSAFARVLPAGWGISEETALGPVRSGPLPMGGSRRPAAVPGMLLVGDAAGLVNPFNGEGIAYALESGEVAAELIHEALTRGRPAIAQRYPAVLRERYGSYFWYGTWFARAIGRPSIMRASTRYLLPNRPVMRFAMRVLANLTDGREGDVQDRLIAALERLAPTG